MRILLASSIAPDAVTRLSRQHELVLRLGALEDELVEAVAGCHVLVFRSGVDITAPVLDAGSELELIVRAGSGYDNIDLEHLSRRKLRFVRVAEPGARAVAEMAFALMLALARQLAWADREWRAGHWVKAEAIGHLLRDKTLGIVGAGSIGSATGRLGVAWGMRVVGCVERPNSAERTRLARMSIDLADLDEVIERADFLSVHLPLTPSTQGLLGFDRLAAMKKGAFLVNLGRGGVVDELALEHLLASDHLAGAALDVHASEGEGNISPLAGLPNAILTPHIGSQTIDTQAEIGRLIEQAISDHLRRGPTGRFATPENFEIL